MADTKSTSRSSRSGRLTTVSEKTRKATAPPTATCTAIIVRPAGVSSASHDEEMLVSVERPMKSAKSMWAKNDQNRKTITRIAPIQGIWRSFSRTTTPRMSPHTSGSSASSRRLTS
jgi:hypothetical protein